ncbi:hypothetical protein TNCV_4580791 [Trichonephila clavipes]|nr:hypothetical protein TNCV_4580791 [Trichonephila clavipes]
MLSSRNRDSSLHDICFQFSTLQSLSSLAQARRAARWRALSYGTLKGRWLPKPIRAENSASTSIQNSKSDVLQNCPLISSLDVKSMKISFSAVESPSEVF